MTPSHGIDFGSRKSTQLIARRLRGTHVVLRTTVQTRDEVMPSSKDFAPKAVILSGAIFGFCRRCTIATAILVSNLGVDPRHVAMA